MWQYEACRHASLAGLGSEGAAGAAQSASGSAPGAPKQRKKILLAMEKWTHTKNNKKTTKKHNFFRKTQKPKNPKGIPHRICPPGRPRRPPGAQKNATRDGEMDARKKTRKFLKKRRNFQKHQKNGHTMAVAAGEGIQKEGFGRGPKSPGHIELCVFCNEKKVAQSRSGDRVPARRKSPCRTPQASCEGSSGASRG